MEGLESIIDQLLKEKTNWTKSCNLGYFGKNYFSLLMKEVLHEDFLIIATVWDDSKFSRSHRLLRFSE